MIQWEYKIESSTWPTRGVATNVLNRLGKDGWELVTSYEDVLFFKRPIKESGIPITMPASEYEDFKNRMER